MKKTSLFLFTLAFSIMLVLSINYNKRVSERILPVINSTILNQLPIYCVQTEEPKIALTFDAACADCSLRKL